MTLSEIRRKITESTARRDVLVERIQADKLEFKAGRKRLESLEYAQALIQKVALETQEQLRFHIEDVVQLAVDSCFPGYLFRVSFEIKRGRTEARIFLEKNGFECSPMDGNGGGMVDTLAFSLRFAAWSLSKAARVILMDEPFKMLSKDLQPFLLAIVKGLSERMGVQVLMVTHSPDAVEAADRVFRVAIDRDGPWMVSKVEVV